MPQRLKPVVLHTGRSITVAEKKEREKNEEMYRVGRLRLEPPDELSERAKLKFRQIVAEAFWLDELSTDLLAAYCHAWDRWLDCVAAMDGNGDVLMVTNQKTGEIQAKQNPMRSPLRQYVTMMSEMSAKLGLSNIDRLKLTNPVTEEEKQKIVENPFEQFMAKVE